MSISEKKKPYRCELIAYLKSLPNGFDVIVLSAIESDASFHLCLFSVITPMYTSCLKLMIMVVLHICQPGSEYLRKGWIRSIYHNHVSILDTIFKVFGLYVIKQYVIFLLAVCIYTLWPLLQP